MICPLYPTPILFFISSEVPLLLYYSHIPVFIISLMFTIFILVNDRFSLLNKSLAVPLTLFNLWLIFDLITWVSNSSDIIMFVWSFFGLLFVLINFYFFRFLYIYIKNNELPKYYYLLFFIIISPIIVLTPSLYNLTSFDLVLCASIEGEFFVNYYNLVGFLIIIYSLFFLINNYKKCNDLMKLKIRVISMGLIPFLFVFSGTSFMASILRYLNLAENYEITQYGLLGAPVFIAFLVYSIVKFKTFNIKLFATQALIWALIVLIGSQFFFIKVTTNFILNGITFVGIIIFGKFLIKSVKREIDQRERLEHLRLKLEESNIKLENANDKLKGLDKLKTEFLSLASHQLRSPLTAIKGYSSMLLEGDYGKIDATTREAIDRIFESSQNLTKVVEDLLNVSKIEQGGMKYEVAPFNLCQMARDETKEFSIIAEKKGLKLDFDGVNEDLCMVNADKEKIRQVLINFIDNSIKYTKNGNIKVSVNNIDGKVVFAIKDTGMGISPEIQESLFEKFARGEGARMNTTGSGLGLYLAKEIAVASKGRVWAESEGMGKGSIFYLELNAIK